MATDNPFGTELMGQWLDQDDAWLRDTVRECGWAVQAVFGEGCRDHPGCDCGQPRGTHPPFAYTVGLYGFGHPEVVVFGLCIDTAAAVLNDLGERVRSGQSLSPSDVLTFDGWPHRMHLFEFRDDGEIPILISAQRFYQRTRADPVPTLQGVWDDRRGRFPWHPQYDPPAGLQPLPGMYATR